MKFHSLKMIVFVVQSCGNSLAVLSFFKGMMLSTSVGEKQGTIKKHLGAAAEHSGGGVVMWATYQRTRNIFKMLAYFSAE